MELRTRAERKRAIIFPAASASSKSNKRTRLDEAASASMDKIVSAPAPRAPPTDRGLAPYLRSCIRAPIWNQCAAAKLYTTPSPTGPFVSVVHWSAMRPVFTRQRLQELQELTRPRLPLEEQCLAGSGLSSASLTTLDAADEVTKAVHAILKFNMAYVDDLEVTLIHNPKQMASYKAGGHGTL